MQLYLAIPLIAAMGLATLAGLCLLMGTELRANRSSAGMLLLGAWWAACEVFWNAAPDAATALFFHRLAAPGFLFIGPLAMLLVIDVAEAPPARIRRALPAAWSVCGASLVLTWTTPWMISSMQRVGWGWGAVPGPAFAAWAAATAVAIGLAVGQWVRDYRGSSTEINRRHGPRVTRFLLPAALVGFASDAVLPIFGVQVPRVGSLSLALAGAVIFWGATRYGFSRLHPQAFSTRILHTLPDGIALTTLHGRIRVANDKLGELLGCTAEDAVGRQIGDHLDRTLLDPPREQREVEAQLRPISGPPLPVCVSTAPVDDEDGAASGVVLAIQDLREVAALRHRLIVSGRLAAVGELAAGIAHELNNPLAFVRSNLSLLRRDWEKLARALAPDQPQLPPGIDDLEALLDESLEGVDRVATIVRDIREFSHAGGSERELADLNAILDQVLRVASAQLDPNVRVDADYRDAGLVYCEPQRMKQVFLNLVMNAGQAIQGAGRIRVATRGEDEQHLHIVVEDDGCGIPPAVRERIFDPFFTTKPVGRGTGLGLSIAYEIVRSHGGEIWVESEPGRGSAFHVRLPRGGDAEAGRAAVGDTRRQW